MNFIKVLLIECGRELRTFFLSLSGYLFLVVFLVLISLITFTYGKFFERGEAALAGPFFAWLPTLFCFFIPALAMKIWSEEIRSTTLELLLSYPVSLRALVLGKFLAIVCICVVALVCTLPIALTVSYLGDPDWGPIITGYIGGVFLVAAYAAISSLMSALLKNQTASYLVSAILCYIPILISSERIGKEIITLFPDYKVVVDTMASLGVTTYFIPFASGVLQLKGILYFSSIVAICLSLNWIVIRRRQILT